MTFSEGFFLEVFLTFSRSCSFKPFSTGPSTGFSTGLSTGSRPRIRGPDSRWQTVLIAVLNTVLIAVLKTVRTTDRNASAGAIGEIVASQ